MFNRIRKFFRREPVEVFPTVATPQQKLIATLRSGDYKQGQGQLRTPGDQFCCLGVACDVYIKETGKGEWVRDSNNCPDWSFIDDSGYESATRMTEDVADFFGMDHSGYFTKLSPVGDRAPTSLIAANDAGYSFEDIAEMIEEGKVNTYRKLDL